MKNNLKFWGDEVCVIADLHFGVHCNSELWLKNAINYAYWLEKELKKEGIKDLIICGDVFHDRNEINVNTLNTVTLIFEIWKDFKIKIVAGNHDCFYKDHAEVNSLKVFDKWDNIDVFYKTTMMEHKGKKISFIPWGIPYEEIPQCDIMFGHYEINGFIMSGSKICKKGEEIERLNEKCPYIFTGHFHLGETKIDSKGRSIIYTGNIYQQDWGDADSTKGYYIVNLDNSTHRFVENNVSPRHIKIYLSQIEEINLKEIVPNNIIQFHVDKKSDEEYVQKYRAEIAALKPFQFDIEWFDNDFIVGDTVELTEFNISTDKILVEFIDLVDNMEYKEETKEYVSELYKGIGVS